MSKKKINSKLLTLGVTLLSVFLLVFIAFFMPVLNGQNAMDYLDNLYNSISKQSAYYIPGLAKGVDKLKGKQVELSLQYGQKGYAAKATLLLNAAGARAVAQGDAVSLRGDLGSLLFAALADADAMFHNQGEKLQRRYGGQHAKQMLYTWWQTMNAMEKSLNRNKMFAEAKQVATVKARAVEMAYNYYGIQPQDISSNLQVVVMSLLFYVVYTLWYGYGVMYLFEGSGFKLSH